MNSGALDTGNALRRGREALEHDERDDLIEDTLLEIVKRLDAIEAAVDAVAQGVMKLQKEEPK